MSHRAQSSRNRSWLVRLGLAVLAATACSASATLLPPDLATTIGRRISFDGFADAQGHTLDVLVPKPGDARPWIVSPMYTRCPHTCSAITAGLRRALAQSGLAASEYRVVSFSFDPTETDQGLREFRSRMQLPADWLVLRAQSPEALDRTVESLDFRTISLEGGNFDHPNLVAILAPDMRLSGYLFGITLPGEDLARAVRRAREGVAPIDTWRPYLFACAAVGFLASGSLFGWLLARRRAHLRAQLDGKRQHIDHQATPPV